MKDGLIGAALVGFGIAYLLHDEWWKAATCIVLGLGTLWLYSRRPVD